MPRSFVQVFVHLVWSTKNREPLLKASFRSELFREIKKDAPLKNININKINGVEDHIHALVFLKSTQNIAEVVKELKGCSSRWLTQQGIINQSNIWQEGYGAFSVSRWDVPMIRRYIENQQIHHQKFSFEKEWTQLHNPNINWVKGFDEV